MKATVIIVVFMTTAVWFVSSDPLDLCGRPVPELSFLMNCIRLKTTPSKGKAFKAMPYKYFLELFNAAKKCEARRPPQERPVGDEIWRGFMKILGAIFF